MIDPAPLVAGLLLLVAGPLALHVLLPRRGELRGDRGGERPTHR